MKLLRFIILAVLQIILILIALDALFSEWGRFGKDPLQQFITAHVVPLSVQADPFVWRSLWFIVLLLILCYWGSVISIWRRRPKALQVRTSGGEELLIHSGALQKYVRLQVENHPAVVSQKIRIRQRGSRGLSIWLWVNVQPIESLPTIKRQLEDSIRNGFAQVLGIEKIDEITIVIGLDEKNLTRRPGPVGTPEPQPEPPARGTLDEPPAKSQPDDMPSWGSATEKDPGNDEASEKY